MMGLSARNVARVSTAAVVRAGIAYLAYGDHRVQGIDVKLAKSSALVDGKCSTQGVEADESVQLGKRIRVEGGSSSVAG